MSLGARNCRYVGGVPLKLRGYLTLGVVGAALLPLDVIQRTVITALAKLRPERRDVMLGRWQRGIAHFVLGVVRIVGGARLGPLPSIPGRPGVLILMNHQSLLDIPIMVASLDNLYPRIVTRSRYAYGKPLISHMIRQYQYPLVRSGATKKVELAAIEEAARTSTVPMAIFPEGTRTRDGSIGRFKIGGLDRILGARQWTVYVVVADGFWRAARLDDFLTSVSEIDGEVRCLGPFEPPAPGEPVDDFVNGMQRMMAETLDDMRNAVTS